MLEDIFHFNNVTCHHKLQMTLRTALVAAFESRVLFRVFNFFKKESHVLYLYQDSRLMAKITELLAKITEFLHDYLAANESDGSSSLANSFGHQI